MSRPLTPNRFATFDQKEAAFGLALRLRVDLAAGKIPRGTEIAATRLLAALDRFINAYEAADVTMPESAHGHAAAE